MNLVDLTGTKYPIIQGGMANIATGEFAAAVSNAGGLGLVASGGMNAEQLREQIRICKSKTDKPFGVNLMLMNPDVDNIANMLIEEKVQFITTGAGNPGKYMKGWKEMGAKVFPVVASVALAKVMVRSGADAVIAEGGESGGHVGDMTTMTLLPQVVAAVDVPVIAAGGIASGKQMAAAMMLGACGVQIGTCLLVSEECPIHDNYKQTLIKSKDNSTTVTGRSQGAPVRIIKNEMAREYLKLEAEGADREKLEQITLGGLRRAVLEGDMIRGSVMAGQVCGQLSEIRPVADILDDMYVGAKDCLANANAIAI
ncbi:MAG: enoyl-[acyl-carrier-protein] reductase FabK [Pseudobutyrivibrio sp.]|jgi:enoyl-[acyl-carrier protein] reductase II|uniref:Probable nitronate monooxygenase n=3 Tax=Pseudobutyrivibrio TaxID=46205 RepID=A0A2G3E7U8_9FIRM|nr:MULTISPECIES: nitronate monooxygenase [Pseudobutyrivibrio]MBE5904888.1 enoyl-[acyl-carrier-protein] reductase FabK [Pseudobutyrivibrio sp.]MBR5952325.1 nitronate monooxygenase [Pseudobutyrivibrio sp.]NEX00321.1 enoyl-[acyl-carrier-protein] reductase FabK [Pseudobutyrivibrio xylanivorans]PHU39317.1 enoyl-[acyl-carrier-protein] reductase FabK [Pseudobutyrivibrio ruminis]SFR84057.1 enoyl-[acyl-carrier protein] reductase II [Pseudobutyrivibrio sp. NOR37]